MHHIFAFTLALQAYGDSFTLHFLFSGQWMWPCIVCFISGYSGTWKPNK